jgi:hypothetical protein
MQARQTVQDRGNRLCLDFFPPDPGKSDARAVRVRLLNAPDPSSKPSVRLSLDCDCACK